MTAGNFSFEEARRSLEQPLRFVCRGGAALDRVKGLDETLFAAAGRVRALATTPGLRRLVDELASALPRAIVDPAERLRRYRRCLALVERMSAPELAGEAPRPEQGGETSQPKPAGEALRSESAAETSRPQPRGSRAARAGAAVSSPRIPPLDAEIELVRGVGPRVAELLRGRGLATVRDLLYFLPRRYEDRRAVQRIQDLVEGEPATVEGHVIARSYKAFRGRRNLEVALGDTTGVVILRWFRVPGPSFAERFAPGRRLRVSGTVKTFRGRRQMVHPEVGAAGDDGELTDALVPLYPEIEGLRPAQLRRLVREALPAASTLTDPLPEYLRDRHGLPALAGALTALHAPPVEVDPAALTAMSTPWHHRLIYEELLLLQLGVLRRKATVQQERGRALAIGEPLAATAARLFPFPLTAAQARVLADIEADLGRETPMQRLLQGDVGSGKTAVALAAAAAAVRAGVQVAIMAPTELLAEQHARVALRTLTPAGVRIELLTGAATTAERRRILGQLASGHIQVVLGTHALIQDDVSFKALGLAVVDEQHRFGVRQRAALLAKGRDALGALPHLLVMTATPIPRTLALTLYGDLDLSILDELPPGRTPVRTMLFRDKQRPQVYERVRRAVAEGRQAYVIYPLVTESEGEGMEGVRDATSAASELAAGPFAGLRIGLLHGRLAADEKEGVMRAFARGEIAVLVATTVVEVGIDVANATVMVIEHAERFGLSQLHQLRGRVGRGAHASECLLVAHQVPSEEAWRRLAVMEETSDGFRIAEEDLRLRGPGDFIGTRQSGLPMLSIADLARDQQLLLQARADAAAILAADPALADPRHRGLAELWRRIAERGLTLA